MILVVLKLGLFWIISPEALGLRPEGRTGRRDCNAVRMVVLIWLVKLRRMGFVFLLWTVM